MSGQEDEINHPSHYTSHPSGIECIVIAEHMTFNVGNAVKYLWRAGLKSADRQKDLKKALWYVQRELDRLVYLEALADINGQEDISEELGAVGTPTDRGIGEVTLCSAVGNYPSGGRPPPLIVPEHR